MRSQSENPQKPPIEWIRPVEGRELKAAVFDFDGTISLIRQGWQGIMYSYFVEVLRTTPRAESEEELWNLVREFVDRLTGKQTIYQVLYLVEEIKKRGGQPEDPLTYKAEYNRRLLAHIKGRVEGLKSGRIGRKELMVPGTEEMLTELRKRGLRLYLASGTDRQYVIEEVSALGLRDYFDGGIYGALDDYKKFSKAKLIQQIIASTEVDGTHLLGFGDGFVEIENVKAVGGIAIGVASDEAERQGVDAWKRERLLEAGADAIIPDYRCRPQLIDALFEGRRV